MFFVLFWLLTNFFWWLNRIPRCEIQFLYNRWLWSQKKTANKLYSLIMLSPLWMVSMIRFFLLLIIIGKRKWISIESSINKNNRSEIFQILVDTYSMVFQTAGAGKIDNCLINSIIALFFLEINVCLSIYKIINRKKMLLEIVNQNLLIKINRSIYQFDLAIKKNKKWTKFKQQSSIVVK